MKYIFFFVLVTGLFFAHPFAKPVSAQQDSVFQKSSSSVLSNKETENLNVLAQGVFMGLLTAATCQVAGTDPSRADGRCIVKDPKTGELTYADQNAGLIGLATTLIASTYTIPISSTQYFADLQNNFGITKRALAQSVAPNNNYTQGANNANNKDSGYGYAGLAPFLPLWKAFRNMTYVIFIIVFVAIGFGIMLRVKIDPRTQMTIQNQIPKIIVGLLLITFSYAIAGVLIDLMWYSMYFIYNLIARSNLPSVDTSTYNPVTLQGRNPLTVIGASGIGAISKDSAGSIGSIFRDLFMEPASAIFGGGAGGGPLSGIPIVGAVISGVVKSVVNAFVFLISGIVTIAAFLIIAIAIVISLFRLWFQLIRAYVFLILDIILGPFWIAAAIMPGSPLGFGKWIRSLAANLAAFPATMVMFLLGGAIMDSVGKIQIKGQFVPPFIGNPGSPNAIASLLGLGVILLTPQVVTMTRDVFKAPQNKYAPGVGQALGVGKKVISGPAGALWKNVTRVTPHGEATGWLSNRFARSRIGGRVGEFLGIRPRERP